MKKQQFQKVYPIATGICILAAALCLMSGCGYLFFTQGSFTRESVAEVFSVLSLPVYLALGMAVLGFLLDIFHPRKGEKRSAPRQEWLILKRLRSRVHISGCAPDVREQILRERRIQRIFRLISAVLAAAALVPLLGYLLSGDRFSREDLNGSVLGVLMALAPGLAANLAWILASGPKYAESCRREIGLLKPYASSRGALQPSDGKYRGVLRLAVLAAAVFLLVWGFASGGAADVLTKAINICTECIGLG